MKESLDEFYLTWLYRQVGSLRYSDPGRTYWALFRQLYKTEFVPVIPRDGNRIADGLEFRDEFLLQTGVDPDEAWMDLGCSMLELLLGVARRLCFEADGDPRGWFWEMLENLDIVYCDDEYNDGVRDKVDDVLGQLVWRQYQPDGRGGLFPLDHPSRDQREVEIWYQLNSYLIERL